VHKFARRVFTIAGIYGLIALLPNYFLEGRIGRDYPPPITHPEYFYGFVGVALAWQLVFLAVGRDPVRLRAVMLPAVLEKLAFAVPSIMLYLKGRMATPPLIFAGIDLLLGFLFLVAYLRTPTRTELGGTLRTRSGRRIPRYS